MPQYLFPAHDAPASEVVKAEFDLDSIAQQHLDVVLSHLAADHAQDLVLGLIQLDLEHGIGQDLCDRALEF